MVTSALMTPASRTGSCLVVLPAVAESIPQARAVAVAAAVQCGLGGEQLDAVRLAVSEAVTNVVRHAYRGTPGDVRVMLSVSGGELVVIVDDDGCGADVPADTPGLGWGRAVMDHVCDGFALEHRLPTGTSVRLCFRRRRV